MAITSGEGIPHAIEAERSSDLASLQLIHYDLDAPIDNVLVAGDDHVLDISLTSRLPNARGRFRSVPRFADFERIGSVFMVPAGHLMHGRSDQGRQTSLHCRFHAKPIERWMEGDMRWNGGMLHACLSIHDAQIRNGLSRLAAELRAPGFAGDTMAELLTAQIAIDLARYCRSVPPHPFSGGLAPWQLNIVEQRLREECAAPTLSELARLCGLSNRHLSRAFRTSRGMSVGRYVEHVRIDTAKQMLAGGRAVKDVAHRMGFGSPSGFAFAFRRATGETPRTYRQRMAGISAEEA